MQSGLFEQLSADAPTTHRLDKAIPGTLLEFPQALNSDEADSYLRQLEAEIPWRQESIRIAGRTLPVPRLQCWMGDAASLYGYSGVRLQPEPWHPVIKCIQARVEQLSGLRFNSVLLNLYRDGQDSVAWHADDEPELGSNPVIASVSLGAERKFQLKPKEAGLALTLDSSRHSKTEPTARRRRSRDIWLKHGSLLIMDGQVQGHWLHQLPKARTVSSARINLTFRAIKSASSNNA